MTASAVELARSTQPSKSLAAVSYAKPSRSFDDILAGQRTKAAEPKPEPRTESTRKTEAKSKPSDEPKPVDDTRDVQADEATDAAETESTESSKTKSTKKTEAKGKANSDGQAVDEDEVIDGEASTESTNAVLPTGLPATEGESNVEIVEEVMEKPAVTAKDDESVVSPDALLSASQPVVPITLSDADLTPVATGEGEATEAAGISATTAKTAAKAVDPEAAAEVTTEAEITPEARPKLKPHGHEAIEADADAAMAAAQVFVPTEADTAKSSEKTAAVDGVDASALQALSSHEKPAASHNMMPAVQSNETSAPQRTVAEENVDRIVTSVRGEMQKGGGTMQIRLDPPSLGQIQLQISIDDGVVSASMQTSNDEATRLLSHNLQQLKSTLESAGVMVDKIQVKQAAPAEQSSSNSQSGQDGDQRQNGQSFEDQSARQEQQRREMLQRMWAKLAGTGDPLDLVA